MAYIGRPLQAGVRRRYIYAATAGQTSFSGNDSNGISLAYDDNLFLDVYQNGVLLKPVTDYASTTGTSVVLTTGASTDDVLEMLVFDTFGIADTVSAKDGGSFAGNMAMGGTLGVTGITTATGGLNVGTIKDVGNNATAMTIDTAGRILQPAKPIFYATADSNISMTTSYAETTAFSNALVNVGSHYNTGTGRFTAPIAGVYNFAVASIGNSTANTYRFRLYKNGSTLNNHELRLQTEGGAYGTNGEFCVITSLSASDYVSIFVLSDNGTDAYGDSNFRYSYFRGHLMG